MKQAAANAKASDGASADAKIGVQAAATAMTTTTA